MSKTGEKNKTKTKKKTSKKKLTKKAKKTNTKKASINLLKNAPKEKLFILSDGGVIKNPKELADVLEHIREEVFNHHVNPNTNDFANWIRDVFKDVKLAEKLANTQGREHTRIVLYRHILEHTTKK